MKTFDLIVATDLARGIGKNNTLPWHCRKEYQHFVKTSSRSNDGKEAVVVMGRRTWDSIPEKYRPLKNRRNIVISTTMCPGSLDGVSIYKNLTECMSALDKDNSTGNVYLGGGSSIYQEGLKSKRCNRVYITTIENTYDCDVFFPKIPEEDFDIVVDPDVPQGPQVEHNGTTWTVSVYQKKKS